MPQRPLDHTTRMHGASGLAGDYFMAQPAPRRRPGQVATDPGSAPDPIESDFIERARFIESVAPARRGEPTL
jgi:hypothetical protein